MLERKAIGERAVLVHINFSHFQQNKLEELRELACSAGADIAIELMGKRDRPEVKFSIGKGKAEELQQLVLDTKAELVIFNHDLTPSQERNLEKLIDCRVLDRTGLILDIFARRAQTFEGKLQVELAQLDYMASRLKRAWTHLERQRGGRIGLTGPGETQLELDKRILQTKKLQILKRLAKVQNARELSRQSREKSGAPTISLVGYTNAGKSTLFNALTGESIYAQDQLFATLDSTLRQLQIPSFGKAILVDTVGFVRNLPHQLVEAFSSTLEETVLADVLLHVVDAGDPERDELADAVDEVLEQIEAQDLPTILVMNKIDLIDKAPRVDLNKEGKPWRVWVSSHTGEGLDLLREAIAQRLSDNFFHGTITIPAALSRLRSQFFSLDCVLDEQTSDTGDAILTLCIERTQLQKLTEGAKVELHCHRE